MLCSEAHSAPTARERAPVLRGWEVGRNVVIDFTNLSSEKNFKFATWGVGVCPHQVGKQSRLMSDSTFGNRDVKGQEVGCTAVLAEKSDLLLLLCWYAFRSFSKDKAFVLVDQTLKGELVWNHS